VQNMFNFVPDYEATSHFSGNELEKILIFCFDKCSNRLYELQSFCRTDT
jgi:hypothetical protein